MEGTKLPAQGRPTAVERLFEAVVEGEPDKVLALLHSKIEWTPTIWSGGAMYRGHEGVHLWLSQFGESLEHLDIRVQKSIQRQDRAAVLGIVFDTRGEQKFAVEVAWSFEMEAGLLRRGCAHDTWQEALEAVGLTEEGEEPSPPPAAERRLEAGRQTLAGRVRQALRPNPACPVGRHFCRSRR